MSQLVISQTDGRDVAALERDVAANDWQHLIRLGAIALLVQLACVGIALVTGLGVGAEPETAAEAFAMFQDDRLAGIVRLDFATLLLLCVYPLIGVGVYSAMRHRPAYALLFLVLMLVGTVLGLANHSAFSIIKLADQYTAATTAAAQAQLLAAGDAILASNMWNSTAGFLAGFFLQGGFVFISLLMLKEKWVARATAYTGLLANGLDLVHIPFLLFAPTVAIALVSVGGIFYVVWFPLLARDMLRLSRAR